MHVLEMQQQHAPKIVSLNFNIYAENVQSRERFRRFINLQLGNALIRLVMSSKLLFNDRL